MSAFTTTGTGGKESVAEDGFFVNITGLTASGGLRGLAVKESDRSVAGADAVLVVAAAVGFLRGAGTDAAKIPCPMPTSSTRAEGLGQVCGFGVNSLIQLVELTATTTEAVADSGG